MRALWLFVSMVIAALFIMGAGDTASAQSKGPRLALVISNGAYSNFDRLSATYTDGATVASALSATGFLDASGTGAVRARRDLTHEQFVAELETFRGKLAAAGPEAMGVLYFAGHGAALGSYGDVVMLPVDSQKVGTVEAQQLSRGALTKTLLSSGAKTVLIVLDMCRNVLSEPVAQQAAGPAGGASLMPAVNDGVATRGLRRLTRHEAALRPDQGFLVTFSTSPDQVAYDDGVFSKIFAEEIRRPQQNIADAMKRVSDRVALPRDGRRVTQKPTLDYALQGDPPCFVSCDPTSGSGRFYDCASCPWMRIIPAGEAQIGSQPTEIGRGRDEPPARPVKIDRPFALGVYEVTVAEWTACVRDAVCKPLQNWSKENPNPLIPASHITWQDGQNFVAWLSAQSGRKYRLPTEAEWEYAARAGSTTAFAFGDEISPSQANYDHTASYAKSPTSPYRGYPEAINSFPPNAFGLYQVHGNMWEWTAGCLDTACRQREVRGGSFQSAPGELRAANRFGVPPDRRRADVGLRVARDLEADEAGA